MEPTSDCGLGLEWALEWNHELERVLGLQGEVGSWWQIGCTGGTYCSSVQLFVFKSISEYRGSSKLPWKIEETSHPKRAVQVKPHSSDLKRCTSDWRYAASFRLLVGVPASHGRYPGSRPAQSGASRTLGVKLVPWPRWEWVLGGGECWACMKSLEVSRQVGSL